MNQKWRFLFYRADSALNHPYFWDVSLAYLCTSLVSMILSIYQKLVFVKEFEIVIEIKS